MANFLWGSKPANRDHFNNLNKWILLLVKHLHFVRQGLFCQCRFRKRTAACIFHVVYSACVYWFGSWEEENQVLSSHQALRGAPFLWSIFDIWKQLYDINTSHCHVACRVGKGSYEYLYFIKWLCIFHYSSYELFKWSDLCSVLTVQLHVKVNVLE